MLETTIPLTTAQTAGLTDAATGGMGLILGAYLFIMFLAFIPAAANLLRL